MVLAGKLKNVVVRGVFGQAAHVSEDNMRAASLTLTDQSCNENAIVAQGLKRHDPELLDQLIVQYQHRLLRYLLYLTGNREMAEDIFQETWMRVLKRGDQFNGKSRFDTWLFTIARNLVIDVRRKRTMSSLEAMREAGEEGGRSFDVAGDGLSPFEMYQTHENGQRVAEALLTLEPLHREVLVLRFHEELSLEEIAQVTRSPLSTVKSRLYRGLSALKPRICAAEAGRAEGEAR
jgi:RNA polymerase sigma-70 factor, ECF subfamily